MYKEAFDPKRVNSDYIKYGFNLLRLKGLKKHHSYAVCNSNAKALRTNGGLRT